MKNTRVYIEQEYIGEYLYHRENTYDLLADAYDSSGCF